MTNPIRIWFNQTYNTNYWLMQMIRNNPDNVPVHIITSCLNPLSPAAQAGDEVWAEPDLSGREYAQWAADFARAHDVDVFLPMKNVGAIAEHAHLFAGLPIAHSTAEAIRVFGHKGDAYAAVRHHRISVPPYRLASTAEGILGAYAELRELTGGDTLILKPATDVGGVGYRRILHDSPGGLHGLGGSISADLSLASLQSILERAEGEGVAIPEYILMPYLDEPEVSIDTLTGPDGSIIGAVPRAKYGRSRLVPEAAGIFADMLEMNRDISAEFGIRYLTNAQFRIYRGEAVLLEVNTRPSGGLFSTGHAGVNMVWACIRVLLGQEQAPLVPKPNSRYLNVETAIPYDKVPQAA
ncbi:MAG TPA: ATP-grasp domain-containing protein [Arthrobacter sp.]